MYERAIKAMEHAARLLMDIDRVGGLRQGGEQYPNGLCCAEDALQLEAAAQHLRELQQLRASTPTEDRMTTMVNRFLAWKLPPSVRPDCSWPIETYNSGTNLLSATEAREMLTHVLMGAEPISDARAEAIAKKWGVFEPSRWESGIPQFHTGLPGVIELCREVWAEALGSPPGAMRRAEDLSPAEVGKAITSGEILSVAHDVPPDEPSELDIEHQIGGDDSAPRTTVRRTRKPLEFTSQAAVLAASPDFNFSEWPDVYVDAEVWREWDGTPTVIAHAYTRHVRPDGRGETYGAPWPVYRRTNLPMEPGTRVEIKHRDGTVTATDAPEQMRWGWTRPYVSAADIVAWRPAA